MVFLKKYKIYLPFALNDLKSSMSYKISFYTWMLSKVFTVLVTYYLWKAIFDSSKVALLNGFSFTQMTTYVIIGFFTSSVVNSYVASGIAREISDGSIAIHLIRPINYKLKTLFTNLGGMIFGVLFMNLPLWGIVCFARNEPIPSLSTLVIYGISTMLSYLIRFLIEFGFGMLAFYTTYFFGMNLAKEIMINFLSGAMIPLVFFPEGIQKLFAFLPFASINYTPVMIYLDKLTGKAMALAIGQQLLWIFILYGISELMWQMAIKRLTILGG